MKRSIAKWGFVSFVALAAFIIFGHVTAPHILTDMEATNLSLGPAYIIAVCSIINSIVIAWVIVNNIVNSPGHNKMLVFVMLTILFKGLVPMVGLTQESEVYLFYVTLGAVATVLNLVVLFQYLKGLPENHFK